MSILDYLPCVRRLRDDLAEAQYIAACERHARRKTELLILQYDGEVLDWLASHKAGMCRTLNQCVRNCHRLDQAETELAHIKAEHT